ncbi:MAG TPA: AAA family ATPase [Candidatus Ignatzschineria merdigallinarum]|uniref:AAA family ATPase n=1 Tax=Candidatus Ignatzschineria merdigallinarum TaxID=2838621 RepID=A0A9D1Q4A2_9GAMM|nr:AAA family ATPase [Candidatus Ignatzschineria merdigallinarum]
MINKIFIDNVATYKSITIDTSAKINLFYGLNGVGKTTIANFLQAHATGNLANYEGCKLFPELTSETCKIYVYNENFIEHNFYSKPVQKGIFTLGEDAVDAQKKIEKAEAEKNTLIESKNNLKEKHDGFKTQQTQLLTDFKENLFDDYKRRYDNTELKFCLSGVLGSKDKFFSKFEDTSLIETVEYDFNDLIKEAKELSENEGVLLTQFPSLQESIKNTCQDLHDDGIWAMSVKGTGDSYLLTLINRLNNHTWIQEGISFLEASSSQCPFCQGNISSDFSREIQKVFDDTYQNSLSLIDAHKSRYTTQLKLLNSYFQNLESHAEFHRIQSDRYSLLKEQLLNVLQNNLNVISRKIVDPSLELKLESFTEEFDTFNKLIEIKNENINAINKSLRDINASRNVISERFWKLIRNERTVLYQTYLAEKERYDKNIETIALQTTELAQKCAEQDRIIEENREKTTNIDRSIDRINFRLDSLGLEGFQIKKVSSPQGDAYQLVRGDNKTYSEDIYRSLSEGEKTLLTLVYFLEMVFGASDRAESVDLNKRIVVFDDPISSLSHNYIFEVARMLHSYFLELDGKNFKLRINQLFLLTHNLYFFHELLKNNFCAKSLGSKLHRVYKINASTAVAKLDKNDVQNDYQAYWQLFKEHSEQNNVFSIMLPNIMRNILEYYFSFIHQIDCLKTALNDLSNNNSDFMPLHRYINRESHSDAINFSEFKDIDNSRHRVLFRKVFEKTGHLEHYNKMMGIDV